MIQTEPFFLFFVGENDLNRSERIFFLHFPDLFDKVVSAGFRIRGTDKIKHDFHR